MFKSATIKLTLWYVVLIMGLSLVFSGVLYHYSTDQIREGLNNQFKQLVTNDHDGDNRPGEPIGELQDRSQHLLQDLVYFNLVVLLFAAVASYILARRTLKPIEAAHQAQVRFTAEASHELRTPLAAMKADTESVLMQADIDPALFRKTLEGNLQDIQKLEKLSNHLLELSRYKSTPQANRQLVELDHVTREALALLKHQISRKDISVLTDIKPVMIQADASSIQQLIIIVLENAVKYSKPNGRIAVKLSHKNASAVLTIIDTGIGIPAADLPHVFEHFYRSGNSGNSNTKSALSDTSGYGLGLPLAKDIVELHDGDITLQSSETKGTTVVISLPLVE